MIDPTKVYDVVYEGEGWLQVNVLSVDETFVTVMIVDPKRSTIQLVEGAIAKFVKSRCTFTPPLEE